MAEDFSRNGGEDGSPPYPPDQIAIDPGAIGSLLKWALGVVGLIVLFGVFSFGRGLYTDLLWYDSLGFRAVFVKITLTRVILFAVGSAVAALVLGASIRIAYAKSAGLARLPIPPEAAASLTRVVAVAAAAATVVLSVIFGSVLSGNWELFLRFTNAARFDSVDPVFGMDLGFFIFSLPMYSFAQGWALGLGVATLIATVAVIFVNYGLRGEKFELSGARLVHLSIIGGFIMLAIAVGHWLDRWGLVFSEDGVVFGATYTDLNARMPALLILTLIAAAAAALMFANAYMRQTRVVVGSVALWIVLSVVLGTVWPALTQQFLVTPREQDREAPYIARNIKFTRDAFGLNQIEEQFYPVEQAEVDGDLINDNLQTINNIRLWDYRPLSNVYRQIQVIRPYYDFKDADVDRYTIDGEYRQVLLSAREVAQEKLDPQSQTWVNQKLVYTHGIGIAMSPVTEFTPEGRPEFFAKDIPVDGAIPIGAQDEGTTPDLIVENPRIYYGENTVDYVVTNSNTEELDYQTEQGDLIRARYAGDGGVRMSSILRRLAYAWQFGDVNLLISGEIRPESLLQYRRTIQERVETVAPFLTLDRDPYIVAADGRLFWIQDAYTTTDHYPYSDPFTDPMGGGTINYMRNSVKVAVDAYNGGVSYYVWDETDPVIRTYRRIFPDLFKRADEMPEGLRAHTRYPQDFFSVQAEKYILYHMQDPNNFYSKEDLWALPNEKFGQGDDLQAVEPYYVIMRLPGEENEEFVQLLPYTPNQRPNMIGWLAARSDGENYGKLVAFNFPKTLQVDGPEQVEARIDNDQEISAWFTLRCSEGSICIRGNLLVIPVGNSLIYAEPVYIQAQGVQFPELKRVILATANRVVMEDSLGLALAQLTGDRSLSGVGAPEPARGETGTGTAGDRAGTFAPRGDLETQIIILSESVESMRADMEAVEAALERLKELTGGE